MSASRRTLSEHREPNGSHGPSSSEDGAASDPRRDARVWLYILECAGERLYTGVASDPDRRFIEHQSGRGARFTRAYPPPPIVQCIQLPHRRQRIMDIFESDMIEPEPPTADVHIKSTVTERVIFLVLTVACLIGVPVWAVTSGYSVTNGLIGGLLVGAIPFVFLRVAYRFEVRADCREVFHRGEFVTRRIPLEQIERIQVASETERGGFWPIKMTKIEILGNDTRMLIVCRSKRIAPFLNHLEQLFPDLIEDTDSLPSV